jgi:hypothetical protein
VACTNSGSLEKVEDDEDDVDDDDGHCSRRGSIE